MPRFSDQDFDPFHKWLGIRKKRGAMTHYDLLGISLDEDDAEVIKSAAEQRKQFVESKRGEGHDSAVTTVILQLQEAEMTLLDPQMRRDYDRRMNLFHKRSKRRKVDPFSNRSGVKSRRRSKRGQGNRSVGEESGIVGTTVKVMAVFMIGFGIMAWYSFQLPWVQSTTPSGSSEVVAVQNLSAENDPSQSEAGVAAQPLDSMDSPEAPAESDPQTSREVAVKNPSNTETEIVPEQTSPRVTQNFPKESPAGPANMESLSSVDSSDESELRTTSEVAGKMDETDFVPIFNGRNLDGWNADRKFWRVEDGVLFGKKVPRSGSDTYAATEGEFGDFILKLKFMLNSGDSGIQFGGQLLPGHKAMTGSHFNLSYERNMEEMGQLYVNKKLFSVPTVRKRRGLANAVNVTGWNDCTISAKGSRIRATINGVIVVDLECNDRKSGSIGLQLHGGGADVAFKEIFVKKIN